MRVDFQWNRPIQQILSDATGGKEGQNFLANEAKRLMDPYVPKLGNPLSTNVRAYVENGKGIIYYSSPYARYQYEGKVMVSKRPGVKGSAKIVKQPEEKFKYTKFAHPHATSHWDQAMMTARGDDLVRAMQNYLRGR